MARNWKCGYQFWWESLCIFKSLFRARMQGLRLQTLLVPQCLEKSKVQFKHTFNGVFYVMRILRPQYEFCEIKSVNLRQTTIIAVSGTPFTLLMSCRFMRILRPQYELWCDSEGYCSARHENPCALLGVFVWDTELWSSISWKSLGRRLNSDNAPGAFVRSSMREASNKGSQ